MAPPTSGALGLLHDERVIQYWDPERALSADIVRSVRADPARYPKDLEVAEDTIIWDALAVFPGDAHWDDALPVPVFYGYPVVRALGVKSSPLHFAAKCKGEDLTPN